MSDILNELNPGYVIGIRYRYEYKDSVYTVSFSAQNMKMLDNESIRKFVRIDKEVFGSNLEPRQAVIKYSRIPDETSLTEDVARIFLANTLEDIKKKKIK